MVNSSDVIVTFKEVPHTDFVERAHEMVDLCVRRARGEIDPVMSVVDCRAIANFITSREPGRSLIDRIMALEGRDDVLSISVIHGFPAADVHDVGTKILVVTDAAPETGKRLAVSLGREVVAFGSNRLPPMPSPSEAVAEALAIEGGPVVLADRWDNPGGGVAGDSTFLVSELLKHPDVPAAIGALWDPVAVGLCHAAGVGAELALRFGGKTAPSSGSPVDARVKIIAVTSDLVVPFAGSVVSLGAAAAIRIGALEIVLASKRAQTFHPDVFRNLGIDLSTRKIVVVKSASHFQAAFAPLASAIIYVNCGGPYPPDPAKIPYTKIRRPIVPLDEAAEFRIR
jgi:microcystin degradation protein MlrC